MDIILDELKRTLKYHKRQHDENLRQIRAKEESIIMLNDANEMHEKTINEIESFIQSHEVKE